MKKLICLLLALLLLTGCAATYDGPRSSRSVLSRVQTAYYGTTGEDSQYGRTDYAYDIYGNQSIELEYRIHSENEEEEPYLKTVRTHDENGNCTRQRQYDVSGWFPRKLVDIRYEYDDQGRMTAHLDKLESQFSWTAVYDDEGMTQTATYPHAVTVVQFDEHGWTIRQETSFENGEISTITYDRRADGQPITARYEENGVLTLHTYTYDDQGRVLTMSETTDSGTELLIRYEYGDHDMTQYNADGTTIVTDYNADGSVHYVYHTDSTGHVTKGSMYDYTQIQVPIPLRRERRPRRSFGCDAHGSVSENRTELPPFGGRNAEDGVPYGLTDSLYKEMIL